MNPDKLVKYLHILDVKFQLYFDFENRRSQFVSRQIRANSHSDEHKKSVDFVREFPPFEILAKREIVQLMPRNFANHILGGKHWTNIKYKCKACGQICERRIRVLSEWYVVFNAYSRRCLIRTRRANMNTTTTADKDAVQMSACAHKRLQILVNGCFPYTEAQTNPFSKA